MPSPSNPGSTPRPNDQEPTSMPLSAESDRSIRPPAEVAPTPEIDHARLEATKQLLAQTGFDLLMITPFSSKEVWGSVSTTSGSVKLEGESCVAAVALAIRNHAPGAPLAAQLMVGYVMPDREGIMSLGLAAPFPIVTLVKALQLMNAHPFASDSTLSDCLDCFGSVSDRQGSASGVGVRVDKHVPAGLRQAIEEDGFDQHAHIIGTLTYNHPTFLHSVQLQREVQAERLTYSPAVEDALKLTAQYFLLGSGVSSQYAKEAGFLIQSADGKANPSDLNPEMCARAQAFAKRYVSLIADALSPVGVQIANDIRSASGYIPAQQRTPGNVAQFDRIADRLMGLLNDSSIGTARLVSAPASHSDFANDFRQLYTGLAQVCQSLTGFVRYLHKVGRESHSSPDPASRNIGKALDGAAGALSRTLTNLNELIDGAVPGVYALSTMR